MLSNGNFLGFDGKPGECYDRPMLGEHSQHPAPNLEREAGSYTRREVCRLLKIEQRQLKSWERQQLIPELAQYRFSDLLALKRIARLRAEHAHPRVIRQAMHALRTWMAESSQASEDVQVYKDGRRVRVQIGKQKLEPGSGQLLFDFAEEEIKKLLHLPAAQNNSGTMAKRVRDKIEADRWFERGLELEQTGAPYEQIIEAYQKAAMLDPRSAGALVNLGTVFFNGHAWADAEAQYKKALEVDPDYALAHFNLGNLYDERGDTPNALHHYHQALKLYSSYADVHYNLALLYQGQHDIMSAVRHWKAFLKLDSTSTWSQIARRELAKLEAKTVLTGNRAPSAKVLAIKSEKAWSSEKV